MDLDIFSEQPFSTDELNLELNANFHGDYELLGLKKSMLFTNIKKVKCDFIREPAKTIRPHILLRGVKLYSLADVCAMKMHTICGRGKSKDFFDIYALLQLFAWEKMLGWFEEKYGDTQFYYLWKSIKYFEDAEEDPDIEAFQPFNATWEHIKKEIVSKC